MKALNILPGLAFFVILYSMIYATLQSLPETRGVINNHHSGDWLTALVLISLGAFCGAGAIRR